MASAIRLLIVDDSADDAELVAEALRSAGLEPDFERVDSAARMAEALERGGWDAIIADHRMPGLSCLAALKIMQDAGIDLPFIVVSGAIGEETAVEAMRAGAHDYVLKQNLTRLAAAVWRERGEAQIRRERRQAMDAIRDLARRSAFLAEASSRLAVSLDYDETLARAARVPLPEAADWCVITVHEDPRTYAAVVGHLDAQREARANELLQRQRLDPLATRGAVQVIRSGQPQALSADNVLVTAPGQSEQHQAETTSQDSAALVGALGFHDALCVPLAARGRTTGAMTLVRATAGRPLDDGDRAFAGELAARVATALDNATLYREAREAIRARDELMSVASHELNTPLATLTLQLEEILLRLQATGSEPPDPGLALARRQVERLSRLVSNLLDVSRITSRQVKLHFVEMDLTAITREVLDQFAVETARVGCTTQLLAARPVVGRWDRFCIEQVIGNLLSNACKYGAGKPIQVSVEEDGRLARLSVRDDGIGIATADRQRIFERFQRAAPARQYGGLGLGLYITRQVVEAHGGTIRVVSQAGAGSTFSVELPLEPPRPAPS